MASFAKIAAVLLVLALFSAPILEARELKSGGTILSGGCVLGYELIGGGCERGDNHHRSLLVLGNHPALTGQNIHPALAGQNTHPALQGGVVHNNPVASAAQGVAGGVGGALGGALAGAAAGALGNPGNQFNNQPPNNGFNQNRRRFDPRNNRNNQNRGNQNFNNQNRGNQNFNNQNRGGNRGSRRGQ